MEIVATMSLLMVRAHVAADTYGLTVGEVKALKLGNTITVAPEAAEKMIAAGHAKEVTHGV